jgi:hypothetical protein
VQHVQHVARTQSEAILPWMPYAFLVLVCWIVARSPVFECVSICVLILIWILVSVVWYAYIDSRRADPSPYMTRYKSRS